MHQATHQWSLYFPQGAAMGAPSTGEFHDGVGTFVQTDIWQGRTMLVRQQFTPAGPDAYHFEQSWSVDFGKTWVANFKADLTRMKS